jgi:hypothetical protein
LKPPHRSASIQQYKTLRLDLASTRAGRPTTTVVSPIATRESAHPAWLLLPPAQPARKRGIAMVSWTARGQYGLRAILCSLGFNDSLVAMI